MGRSSSQVSALMEALKVFDAYPKTLEDFRVKTNMGALVSLAASLLITYLVLSEFLLYLQTDVRQELQVDKTFGDKIRINVDITFHRLPCSMLSLDAMDVSGELQLDIEHDVFKKRLDLDGRAISGFERDSLGRDKPAAAPKTDLPADYCGSCYGAQATESECCNNCDAVREAYRKKGWSFVQHDGIEQCVREGFSSTITASASEGCSVTGHLTVNKMAGNVHVAPGKSYQLQHMHVHDVQTMGTTYFNMTHTIRSLSFGTTFPGVVNPLDGVTKVSANGISAAYQYFIKLVPTTYTRDDGHVINTNQFSVTEHERAAPPGSQVLPGVFFQFDPSPMSVHLTERSRSFAEFLTSLMAIVGGVFTVAGVVDSVIYHGQRSLAKKLELGKHS
eukprot:c13865_g1_i1.p1 GENE.c13865_g1_i1~~c13865_g1_i1.p1  ORF type:complete len:390 (-),score=68.95 c13865_g1_i1:140-1309(-)